MASDRPGDDDQTRQGESEPSPAELDDFSARLGEARKSRAEKDKVVEPAPHGAAMRLGSDFIAGIIVGGLLGWGIDRSFGTTPFGLIICLGLGFGVGTRNAIRTAKEMNDAADNPPGSN